MSAVCGVMYTCDKCGVSEVVWRENGTVPAIRHDIPPGWRRSHYAQSTVKPLHQRMIACPECAPDVVAAEAAYSAWSKAHGEAYLRAHADGNEAIKRWEAENPRPSFLPTWAKP